MFEAVSHLCVVLADAFTLRLATVMLAHYRRASPGTITINKGTAESCSFRIQNGSILPRSNATEK